jgi:hypothetical protein
MLPTASHMGPSSYAFRGISDLLMSIDFYEVRPRKDRRGFDLISQRLPFGRLWYAEPGAISNAVGYAKFRGRSHGAVIRVYDEAGNVIETHEHAGASASAIGSDAFNHSIRPFAAASARYARFHLALAACRIATWGKKCRSFPCCFYSQFSV